MCRNMSDIPNCCQEGLPFARLTRSRHIARPRWPALARELHPQVVGQPPRRVRTHPINLQAARTGHNATHSVQSPRHRLNPVLGRVCSQRNAKQSPLKSPKTLRPVSLSTPIFCAWSVVTPPCLSLARCGQTLAII